jgi:hypothetical protein
VLADSHTNDAEVIMSNAHCHRGPDWRARRCALLVESGRRPARYDDAQTKGAYYFFRGMSRAECERQRQRVRRRWPHVAAALGLRQGADAFRRWQAEALLLAGEPISSVAARLGIGVEALQAYVALFFDVVDHLDAQDFIAVEVIGLRPDRELTEGDAGVFLKAYAYFAGVHAFSAVLDYYRDREALPGDIGAVEPSGLPQLVRHLRVRTAILSRCLPEWKVRPATLLHLGAMTERVGRHVDELSPGSCSDLPPVRVRPGQLTHDLHCDLAAVSCERSVDTGRKAV